MTMSKEMNNTMNILLKRYTDLSIATGKLQALKVGVEDLRTRRNTKQIDTLSDMVAEIFYDIEANIANLRDIMFPFSYEDDTDEEKGPSLVS